MESGKRYLSMPNKNTLFLIFILLIIVFILISCKDERYQKRQELINSIVKNNAEIDFETEMITEKKVLEGEAIDLGYMTITFKKEDIEKIEYWFGEIRIYKNSFMAGIGLPYNYEIYQKTINTYGVVNREFLINFVNTREDFDNLQTYKYYKNLGLTKVFKKDALKKMSDESFEEYCERLDKKAKLLLCKKALLFEQDSFNAFIRYIPRNGARGRIWNKKDDIFHNIRIVPTHTTAEDVLKDLDEIETDLIDFILSMQYKNNQNPTTENRLMHVEEAMRKLKIIK